VQSDPYNRYGQCAGHSVNQSTGLDRESFQLWLGPAYGTRSVTTCAAYSSPAEQANFEQAVRAFLGPVKSSEHVLNRIDVDQVEIGRIAAARRR
jgi:hypothetical protein